jgi:hypothetical protein
MSDSSPATVSGVQTFLKVSKDDFGRNIFGSPVLHSFIRAAYTMGTFMIVSLVLLLSPTFLLALIALIISRVRYSVTKLERDVEKNGAFIDKVSRSVFLGTGIRLQPENIVRLWMNRMIISDGWVFTVKNADTENFEIVGAVLGHKEKPETMDK